MIPSFATHVPLTARRWMTRAAPLRLRPAPAVPAIVRVGDLAPAPAPAPTADPAAPASATGPGPFIPAQKPDYTAATRTWLSWGGSLLGLASGAAFGFARGGTFPALGYGVLGTVIGTGAGYIVANLVTNPTQNPIGG